MSTTESDNPWRLIVRPTWLLLEDTNNVLGLQGRGIGEGVSFRLPKPIFVWSDDYSSREVKISVFTHPPLASQLNKRVWWLKKSQEKTRTTSSVTSGESSSWLFSFVDTFEVY